MEWSDCEKLRDEETDAETDYCKEQRIRLGVKFFPTFSHQTLFFLELHLLLSESYHIYI